MNTFATIMLWVVYILSLYFAIFWLLVFLSPEKKKVQKKLIKFPVISIAVPAYNEEKQIDQTINSILELDYPKDKLEIVVINDGSKDKTEDVVKKIIKDNPNRKIVLLNQENKGKGAALNNALRSCKGDYFVCLDADSSVDSDALKKMLPHFRQNVAAVIPSLKIKNPKNALQRMQWYEYIINIFYKALMSRLNCVHVAPGPFSVYDKSILEKVGGFDEDNLVEDLEITLRLQKHNYEIIQILDTNAYTIAPNNIRELYRQRNRWYKGSIYNAINYRNMIFNKKYGDFGMIQMPTIIISGIIALVMILSILYYSLKPYVKGMFNLSLVNFDLMTFLKSLTIDFNFLDLNFMLISVAIAMLIITMFIIKKSHISLNEKITKYGVFPLFYYLLLYFLILGVMWIGISFDLVLGRKQRW